MNIAPLLSAPFAVQIHVATVLPAVFIGGCLIVLSRKGSPPHRALGYAYLVLMGITAVAALFIHELNPNGFLGLSPTHLFSGLTLYSVATALRGAYAHNIAMHRNAMLGLYVGGILIAGTLAFTPGRIMHAVAFGP